MYIESVERPFFPWTSSSRSFCRALVGAAAILSLSACVKPSLRSTAEAPLTAEETAQLWVEPDDIESRDLFAGPGGPSRAPRPDVTYKVTAVDRTGYSPGYDVQDAQGRKWRIKLGDEVQPEIVASRLLWAIGFHQPATYFLSDYKLDGGRSGDEGRSARFRLEADHESEDDWSWHENPFVGARPFRGLLVANLILNNWDLKGSQNRIYGITGEDISGPRRLYVVQDLGAALGKTSWPTGSKNNIDDFESQNLIAGMKNGRIDFDYHARHGELFEDITPADVVWTCELFSQLTDQQWRDAFRAARYPEDVANRFITKLKSKVQEGLALTAQAGAVR